MFCVLADHPNHPAAVDDLALHANLLYGCTDLHWLLPFSAHRFHARLQKTLFVSVDNSPAIQIIRAKLHRHAIARQDADEVLAHPARDMGQDLVVVLELHLEHSVGQRLGDRCHDLNRVFLRQTVSTSAGRQSRYRLVKLSIYSVKTFAPVAVTATVCSK